MPVAPKLTPPALVMRNRSVVPAATITVLDKPAVPATDPIIVLLLPVVRAVPESAPRAILLLPVVLFCSDARPTAVLLLPVVL